MLIERARVVDFEERVAQTRLRSDCEGHFGLFAGRFARFGRTYPMGSRMMRVPPAADAAHAHQVVGGKAQQRLARELGLTDQLGLGQTTHRLDPAKGLLDALAHLQAGLVALVALDAPSTAECLSLAATCGVTLSLLQPLMKALLS
jgi:hypothetical protein